ncbi:hypothetical protein LAJ57_14005, partial [Streptococcus pneumoniae]|uniref:hypothetical protein n=1 Tax=Streptococcus pneumoniae TaxID=1313 RepID=UPI001CBF7B47
PDIVDGRIDNTVYQIGPIEIGGGISFPLIHEGSALGSDTATICGTSNSISNMAQFMWEAATAREGCGNIMDSFDIYLR